MRLNLFNSTAHDSRGMTSRCFLVAQVQCTNFVQIELVMT